MSNRIAVSIMCYTCGIHVARGNEHACKGQEWKTFHTAKFFTYDDSIKVLSHQCWTESIAEVIDNCYDPRAPKTPIDDIIADACPITIYAYEQKTVSPRFGEGPIDSMLDDFDENYWGEEYGGFDDHEPPWDEEELKEVKKKFYALMEECLKSATPWQCEVVATKEFDEEEVTAILKEYSPEWWDVD